jgi:hypothetical protein
VQTRRIVHLITLLIPLLAHCAAPSAVGPTSAGSPGAKPAQEPAAAPTSAVVARVDGQTIAAAELAAHQTRTGLERAKALDDLIDLALLRAAATELKVALPADLVDAQARAGVELAVAQKLGLPVPATSHSLIVDHAWVKDSQAKKRQAAQRAAMERLRSLVEAGDTIPSAYPKLGLSGAAWHIGDHEEYDYEVVPPEGRDLPAGTLSPIVPGNGGLHLFKIIEHKQARPAADAVSSLLRPHLRNGKAIELAPL